MPKAASREDFLKKLKRAFRKAANEMEDALEDHGELSGEFLYAKGYSEAVEIIFHLFDESEASKFLKEYE